MVGGGFIHDSSRTPSEHIMVWVEHFFCGLDSQGSYRDIGFGESLDGIAQPLFQIDFLVRYTFTGQEMGMTL